MSLLVFLFNNKWLLNVLCALIYTTLYLTYGVAGTTLMFILHWSMPFLFKYSKKFRCRAVFCNFVQWPPFLNHQNLKNFGIEGGRDVSIRHYSKIDGCKVDIGVWHILPRSSYKKQKWAIDETSTREELDEIFDDEITHSEKPIFLYLHGISNSRAFSHRVAMYKVLQELDVHVVTFDYRGFGDSTNILPTKPGVIEDSVVVYSWIRGLCGRDRPVYVWGHSLGSALAAKLLSNLDVYSKQLLDLKDPLPKPKGLILESTFYSITTLCFEFPPLAVVTWLPHYKKMVSNTLKEDTDVRLITYKYVQKLSHLPILQLHSRDDELIPFWTGCEIRDLIKACRTENDPVALFEAFDKGGHMWISNNQRLPQIVKNFITITT